MFYLSDVCSIFLFNLVIKLPQYNQLSTYKTQIKKRVRWSKSYIFLNILYILLYTRTVKMQNLPSIVMSDVMETLSGHRLNKNQLLWIRIFLMQIFLRLIKRKAPEFYYFYILEVFSKRCQMLNNANAV